jgi:hypothetical protein
VTAVFHRDLKHLLTNPILASIFVLACVVVGHFLQTWLRGVV